MEIEGLKLYKAIKRDDESHFSVLAQSEGGRVITSETFDIRDAKKANERYKFLKESVKGNVSIELYIKDLET